MANLVNLERAVKAYGERPLLDGVSAGVAAGDRIGIVGRNGAGKSTLLAVLAGREPLDSGRATRSRDVRIGVLPQRSELTGTVHSVVLGDTPEHVWAASRVLLPAPLRPTMPIRSPAATPADTPSSSGRSPYALTARSRLTRFTGLVTAAGRRRY